MSEYTKTNHHLTICSANYLRLKKIMLNFKKKTQRLKKNDANKNFIADIRYSSISKHTAELYLEFSNLESKILHSFNFVSNVYHDVELVEVASFNGYAPVSYTHLTLPTSPHV